MNLIELPKLPINGLDLPKTLIIPKNYYQNTDILSFKKIELEGKIFRNKEQDIWLVAEVKGIMVLPDSRTLMPIDVSFQFQVQEKIDESNEEIKEYYEKNKNTLDIIGILWENIVLEVPISVTKGNLSMTEGQGWGLVEEKNEIIDPRLAPLRQLLDKEKE